MIIDDKKVEGTMDINKNTSNLLETVQSVENSCEQTENLTFEDSASQL